MCRSPISRNRAKIVKSLISSTSEVERSRAKPFYLRGLLEGGLSKYITKMREKRLLQRCIRDYGLTTIYSNLRKPYKPLWPVKPIDTVSKTSSSISTYTSDDVRAISST